MGLGDAWCGGVSGAVPGFESPRAATEALYRLSCDIGGVHFDDVARNVAWTTETGWGRLELTINLAKPEKDPRAIAAAGQRDREAGQRDRGTSPRDARPHPDCQLCFAAEDLVRGDGRGGLAAPQGWPATDFARRNPPVMPIELGGRPWGLWFSPYAYFDRHCIAGNAEHVPMRVDSRSIGRLLDFVDLFPHYFVGSNADLPIVGGSILAHDHFQGGAHEFPLDRAPVVRRASFSDATLAGVGLGVVRWPLTVLRLECDDRDLLAAAAARVVDAWGSYGDPAVGIVARDADGTPHNTVTPFAHRIDRGADSAPGYRLDLALRCNVTSDEHPLGVFHPHAGLHHIKRENIGLIEVAGLAILPGRLKRELDAVAHAFAGQYARLADDELTAKHAGWALEVASRRPELYDCHAVGFDEARAILYEEVGQVFARVLEDCGVFKWDAAGRDALDRFLGSL